MSPALRTLEADGWEIVVPSVGGFDGESGFVAPDEYLDWLTVFWDAIDATGALPCPVVGASVGGMIAAELAAMRPEIVTSLSAAGAVRHRRQPTTPASTSTPSPPPSGWVTCSPRVSPTRSPIASATRARRRRRSPRYLSDIASASLLWPLGDRGVAKRIHRIRCPKLVVWGDQDELLVPGLIERWGGAR